MWTMQGSKKQADGQSDSSSIGSLLDDTDREVCSLTDRAFKSLCVAELQTPYTDVDPVGPSGIPHQFSSKFFHGPWNHAIKKNTNFHRQQSEKGHATFLLSKVSTNSKTHEDKKYSLVSPSIRKLDFPLSDLHNCTHISKVSSLIKTFNKVDNQVSLLIAKQPANSSWTGYPFIYGDETAFWNDRTIVNIQTGISELPEPRPSAADPSDRRKGHSKAALASPSHPGPQLSQEKASNAPRFSISFPRTGKGKEGARKSSFLHSENSAFESWGAHHKKLIEMGEKVPKEGSLGYFEETPFFPKPCVSQPKMMGAFVLEESFSDDPSSPKSLSRAALPLVPLARVCFPSPAEATGAAAQQLLLPQALAPVCESPSPAPLASSPLFPPGMAPPLPVSKAPAPPPSPPWISLPSEAALHPTDAQGMQTPRPVPVFAEKTPKPDSELRPGGGCPPPWRKQKATLGRMKLAELRAAGVVEIKDSPYRKSAGVVPLAKACAAESRVVLSDSPFGISALLTPALPQKPKNEGPPGSRLLVVTPFLLESAAAKEPGERTFYSQNDYKSKAPRLLFNLKDIRKRVKSTYSPSPLLRGLEDPEKLKGQPQLKADVLASSVLDYRNKEILAGTNKVNIFEQIDYIEEKDNFTSLNENFVSDDVMLSLSKSRAGILKYQNKNHFQQSNSVYAEGAEAISAHEHNKTQPASSPEPFLSVVAAAQQEDMQKHKYKKVTLGQDADEASKNLFSPAEVNRSNSGSQACSLTGNGPTGGRSPSPSEQLAATTAGPPFHGTPCSLMQLFQKACLQESQRQGSGAGGGEQQGGKEREKAKQKGLHNHLLSNCGSAVDGADKGKDEGEDALPEAVLEGKEEDGWRGTDCEVESKAGEPLTPAVSTALKPTLFTIKDNTFKSPPVTKAIKLPLLRSLSCEVAAPNTPENPKDAETDREGEGEEEEEEEEEGWGSIQGNRGPQVTDNSSLTANYSFSERFDHFSMMADSEETDRLSALSEKEFKSPEKLAISKEKVRIRKLRPSSAIQPSLDFESEPRESGERERPRCTKSRAFTRQKGGPCIKKIISHEVKSPTGTENQASSPASSDAFGVTSSLLSNSAGSTRQSPRSDIVVPSASTAPLSDTTADLNIPHTEKVANFPLHKAIGSIGKPSTTPTFDPEQAYQLPGDPGSPLGTNERLQLMSQMGRTAAKPPTVPPKTEKALRRAKKLASRRKKMEAQQKKLQEETLPQNEDASRPMSVPSLRSLICPDSPLTTQNSGLVKHQHLLSSSSSPSLPATQRKLLQDPDSGEYFIVDLPLRLKTLYDPESGRYVQVSTPPSKRDLSRTPSSEASFHTCAWAPSPLPLRVASLPTLPSSTPLSRAIGKASGTAAGEPLSVSCPGPSEGLPCPDAALLDIRSQSADGSPSNSEKGRSPPAPETAEGTEASAEELAVAGVPQES